MYQGLRNWIARTATGEVRQASCSKRLRKLRLRACSTFLCYDLQLSHLLFPLIPNFAENINGSDGSFHKKGHFCGHNYENAKRIHQNHPFYGQTGTIVYKKNELRHSREAPHTNHIINNTKTNNRVQRYGDFPDLQ